MNPNEIIEKYNALEKLKNSLKFVNTNLTDCFASVYVTHMNPTKQNPSYIVDLPKKLQHQIQDLVLDWVTRELKEEFDG